MGVSAGIWILRNNQCNADDNYYDYDDNAAAADDDDDDGHGDEGGFVNNDGHLLHLW